MGNLVTRVMLMVVLKMAAFLLLMLEKLSGKVYFLELKEG